MTKRSGLVVGVDASNIRLGGGVTHLKSLLDHFERGQFGIDEIRVWSGRETLDQLPDVSGLTVVHEPVLDQDLFRRSLWQRRDLPKKIDEECDLLFSPGGTIPRTTKPAVTMCQNMLPFSPVEKARYGLSPTRLRLELLKRAQTSSFRRSRGVIFLSDYAKKSVGGLLGPQVSTTVIAHGVDDQFRCAPRPARKLEECSEANPLQVVYISTIDLYKHQWSVAEGIHALREEGLPIQLEMIGPSFPAALARLEETLERLDSGGKLLSYLGPLPHRSLPDAYRAADLFVFASSCENLPIILIEAMASGLAIASSDRGPMPEALGDSGCYFDPEDPQSIADAVRGLAIDVDRRNALAESAFARSRGFEWERCARETFAFLSEMAI